MHGGRRRCAGRLLGRARFPVAQGELIGCCPPERDVFRPVAERAGITVEAMLAQAAAATPLKRLPTLDEVANTAVFLASDQAGAMTGAIANLSCGLLLD